VPGPADGDGRAPLRTPRRTRGLAPRSLVTAAPAPRRSEGCSEEHDDPYARGRDRGGEILRTADDALHPSRRTVRPGLHLRTEEGPVFAAHPRLPAGGELRVPRRDLEGEQLDPEQPPGPDQRTALLQRRRGPAMSPRDAHGGVRRAAAGRGAVCAVRPLPPSAPGAVHRGRRTPSPADDRVPRSSSED